jgi:hypothetical protein
MTTNTPDRINLRVLLMLAILGALLAIVGWFRYFGAA